ncbi:hypothetical protein BDP55DRAFT_654559, partial [Colletotrichum godetiae]
LLLLGLLYSVYAASRPPGSSFCFVSHAHPLSSGGWWLAQGKYLGSRCPSPRFLVLSDARQISTSSHHTITATHTHQLSPFDLCATRSRVLCLDGGFAGSLARTPDDNLPFRGHILQ